MGRECPSCGKKLPAFAVRCECGTDLPEARDIISDPDSPTCSLCHAAMELTAEQCPSCKARGYPALRPRQSKKSLGVGDELTRD